MTSDYTSYFISDVNDVSEEKCGYCERGVGYKYER